MTNASQERCLVLTDAADAQQGHVPYVAQHLPQDYLMIIDPVTAIASRQSLSFEVSDSLINVNYAGKTLDNITSVWDRRPTPGARLNLDGVDPAFRSYSRKAITVLSKQIHRAFDSALWISDYEAVQQAERKVHQLSVASKLGFTIPCTLFTSDPKQAEAFVKGRPATVIKGLDPFGPVTESTQQVFLSKRVTPDSEIDYSQLNFGPAIFQDAVEVEKDLRISVVNDEVYAATIEADTEKGNIYGVRDWRLSNFEGRQIIEACTLSEDIAKKCVLLVKTLNLQFGAIDMILDKKGMYWFIEINPNGQWAFVEEQTKQPIGLALARLILSASER